MSSSPFHCFEWLLTCLQRIKKWYYNHGKVVSPRPATPTLDLRAKPLRKVVPLTSTQAYTLLFCKRNSPLYKEVHAAWKLYCSGDEDTITAYSSLLPPKNNPNLPFVTFQQALLKDRLTSASEEEKAAIQELIDTRFEEDSKLRECPWEASKVNDLQTSAELQRAYVQE